MERHCSPTTFVSSSSLQAAISAADISKGGTASITVATPAPGGGTSNAITVPIDNPAPVLAALNPNPALAGTGAFTLMVSCGKSALAILRSNYGAQGSQGRLYLIQDVNFVHIQSAAVSPTERAESAKSAESGERVRLAWRPIIAADTVKRLHAQESIEHKQ